MITGLLTKASDAKQANEEATAIEKIQVEVAGSYGLDGKIDKTQLINNLGKIQGLTYNNSAIDENTNISSLPVTVKLNGYAFTILENGDVDKIQWIDNNNGSYTNAETGQTLTVGDTVKYETILNSNSVDSEKLLQLKTDLQHYSGDSSSTDNANIDRDNLTWKFLDIKNGQIRLISAVPTTKKIRLNGTNGYNNAVYLIDKACDTLYSVSGAEKVQNLKIEDIEEKINIGQFDYTQYENSNVDTGKYGGTKEYTSNLKYPNIYKYEVGCKAVSTADNTGNTLGLSSQTNPVTGSSVATSRIKVTQTSWNKQLTSNDFMDTKYYSLFINNGSNLVSYWLSSRCVKCESDYAYFFGRRVADGSVGNLHLLDSSSRTNADTYAFRPVVTLNSDVQLEPDGTNTWKIK